MNVMLKITIGLAEGLTWVKGGKDFSGIGSYHRRDFDFTLDLPYRGLNFLSKERIAI